MKNYYYKCFIPYSQKFGLIDGDGNLRCTSENIEGIVEYKKRIGWGKIIRIKVTEKEIKFGEELK